MTGTERAAGGAGAAGTGGDGDSLWDPDVEAMPRDQLRQLQGERLAAQAAYVYRHSPLFASLLDAHGTDVRKIASVEDITAIPLLEKESVRRWAADHHDIFGGTACVPPDDLYLVNHSTGTSGAPTVYGLSRRDAEQVADVFARSLHTIGLRAGDRTPLAATAFWHGWVIGFELGLRRLGAVPYRMAFNTMTSAETIFRTWAHADFTALRTYIPEVELEVFTREGFVPTEIFPNARFVYGGFDVSAPKRRLIERIFGLPFRNTMGSGDQYFIGAECASSPPYFHMPEDRFVFEVVDPVTGEPVPPGGTGELVVTNLWAEAFPYLRYRMGDIVTYETDPCPCGRTGMRLHILGRMAWSVNVAGRRIFHGEVEGVVWEVPGLEGAKYQLVRRRAQPQEALEVRVGPPGPVDDDVARALEAALSEAFGVPASATMIAGDELGLKGSIKMDRLAEAD